MNINTKLTTSALTALTLLAAGSASQAAVVYRDTFDGDGVTNTKIGGTFETGDNNIGAPAGSLAVEFMDAGSDLVPQTNSGNRVAWMHSTNQFDLSNGFVMLVDFTTAASGNPSFTSSFGIVDEITSVNTPNAGDPGNLSAFMQTDQALNAVGFSATTRNGFQGLNSDFGTLTSLSDDLDSAVTLGSRQLFTLTVNADGSGTATLNSTSANLTAGQLSSLFTDSADGEFYFAAYSQGNSGLTIHEVSINALDAIPEPSSTALLGLGGLALILRRRK
ncbi:MAG: PEP-CTERM sorting domain-containing protein [Akkermansiaceae bacterium]